MILFILLQIIMSFLSIKANHTNFTNEVIRNTSTQIIFTVLKDQNISQIIYQDLHYLKTKTNSLQC